MANEETIQTVFEVVDRMSKTVDKINSKLDKYGKSVEDANKKSKKAEGGLNDLGGAAKKLFAVLAVKKIAQVAVELGNLGAKAKFVEKNFVNFAEATGKSLDSMMGQLRTATQGMVSDLELQQFAMQSMVSGVEFDDMITAMQFVSRQAIATGANVSEKMRTVMTGFARGSAMFLDDVGIQVMGAEDVVGAAVEQMKEKMGLFADAAGTAAGNISTTKTEIENTKAAIGEGLIPVTRAWGEIVLEIFKQVKKVTDILKEGEQLKNINKALKEQARTNRSILAFEQAKTTFTESQLETVLEALKTAEKYTVTSKEQGKLNSEAIESLNRINKELEAAGVTWDEIMNINSFYNGSILEGEKALKKQAQTEKARAKATDALNKGNKESLSAIAKLFGITNEEAKKLNKEWDKFLATNKDLESQKDIDKRVEERAKKDEEIFKEAIRRLKTKKEIDIKLAQSELDIKMWQDGENRRIDQEYFQWLEEQRLVDMQKGIQAAQSLASFIASISNAKMSQLQAEGNAEIKRIKESRMSEKRKADAIKKINEQLEQDKRKAAMTTWAMQVAAATGDVGLAISSTLADQRGGAITKLAAALTIGAAATNALGTVIGAKPRFFNGGEVPNNGRIGDSQLAMVRSGERVLTPAENRAYKVAQNKTTNNRNISVNTTVNVSGGNPEEVQFAVENAIGRAIEKADRNGGIDYSRMPNLQNTIRGV